MKGITKVLMILSVGLIVTGCSCATAGNEPTKQIDRNEDSNNGYYGDFASLSYEVAQRALNSTVAVSVNDSTTGSGVIYRENADNAYVLTNAHVIVDSTENHNTAATKNYQVILYNDGKYVSLPATYIRLDKDYDVAVLSFSKNVASNAHINYSVAEVAETEAVRGESVFGVGHPYENYFDIVRGYITSSKLATHADYIADNRIPVYVYNTTATINPGNSGGPLFNSEGKLIGINTMYPKATSDSSPYRNFNYPIHITTFKRVADFLLENANSPTLLYKAATLNLTVQSVFKYSADRRRGLGIADGVSGLYVENANGTKRSDTDELIPSGTIITEVNGIRVNTVDEFFYELEKYNVGSEVTLSISGHNPLKARLVEVVRRAH